MVINLAQCRDPSRLASSYRPVVAHSTDRARNCGITVLLAARAFRSKALEGPARLKNVYCPIADRRGFGFVAGARGRKKASLERDPGLYLVLHHFERKQHQF